MELANKKKRTGRINIPVNNQLMTLDVDEQMPLLYAIRDELKLTGTKFGCGKGLCGACTVHINGAAARSCQLPVSGLTGVSVTTIEGLPEQSLVKKAFIEKQVPQCGFCIPGQVMMADALLKQAPQATKKQIKMAMTGNLCRCGTYPRIIEAVQLAQEGL